MSDSQVTTLDDAPPTTLKHTKAAAAAAAAAPKAAADAATAASTDTAAVPMFHVTIHATGDDAGNDIVDLQPNGRLYRLPRGVPCLVPAEVLHILENAVVTKYIAVGADVVERSTPRFPFTAVPA